MPLLHFKTRSRLIPAAESPLRSDEIARVRALQKTPQTVLAKLPGISNRQFLARLETAVTYSEQRIERHSNRHIGDPLLHNVCSPRATYTNVLAIKMEVKESPGAVSFEVRVSPRASRDAIEGEHAGALKIRLTAPPVEDRANESLRRLLARCLKVPFSAVRIVAGEKSRTKRVSVSGVTREQVLALISPTPAEARGTAQTKDR
jgi:uncharacterized protein (TIGR00251 family)